MAAGGLAVLAAGLALFASGRMPTGETAVDARQTVRYARAKAAWVAGRVPEARAELESLVASAPGFLQASFLLGRARFFEMDYDGAGRLLSGVLEKQPANLDALIWLAQSRLMQGRDREAEQLVSDALAANPQEPRLSFIMASILERRDNLAGALGFLQGAEGMEADLALVYLESARLRYRMGQADAARERLVKARHLLPEAHPLARPVRELLAAIDRPAVKAGK